MKHAVLDTNFILSCAKQKIDFVEEIQMMGLKILIPTQVLAEIDSLVEKNIPEARLAKKILEKTSYEKITLTNNYVDRGLLEYAKKNPFDVIATLDREIKKKTGNSRLVIRGKNSLEVLWFFCSKL